MFSFFLSLVVSNVHLLNLSLFLDRLRELLQRHRRELCVDHNSDMATVRAHIMNALLRRCAETRQEVQLACSACIGEVGAVDPAFYNAQKALMFQSRTLAYIRFDVAGCILLQ